MAIEKFELDSEVGYIVWKVGRFRIGYYVSLSPLHKVVSSRYRLSIWRVSVQPVSNRERSVNYRLNHPAIVKGI